MTKKWQLPLLIRFYRGASIFWVGIEWRSPRYNPRLYDWDDRDISGMLKSYDD